MTEDPRKCASNTRGKPFEPGNPGKPKGARHKTTLLAEKLMQEDAEKIVKAVLDAAGNGDMTAARIVLDRIAPARRDNPVTFDLPKIERPADAVAVHTAILAAVANGEISPGEAADVARLVDGFVKTIELVEIDERLKRLEGRAGL
jgi:hypothetical protein